MTHYYHANAPGTWGTSNYRFGYPPEPHFRPQSSWAGLDYYQAHSLNPDPTLYHRVREGQYDVEGVGLREARYWHRQAYGGFGDVRTLSPRELGHAAAYEAYRIWIHNRSISDVRSDYGQRRETFIALAIAEVSHVFPSGQVNHERRKFREACETAAATASTVFHTLDDDGHSSGSRLSPSPFHHRSGSASSDDFSDDLYAFDENAMPHRSHQHRRRSSSVSFNSRPMIIPPGGSPYRHASNIPIPVNQPSHNYGGGSPYHPGSSPYSSPSPYHGPASYPQQYPGGVQGVPLVGNTYDPNQTHFYQSPGSYPQQTYDPNQTALYPGSYPQQTYLQAQPGMSQNVPMVPGSTVLIQQPLHESSSRHKRRHKHRSESRDGRRHRSQSDAGYLGRY